MTYNKSQIDKENVQWFKNNDTVASLKTIILAEGTLRGLYPFKINFQYPISVIAGENGAGKSTILALAACAFHNGKNGYKLVDREKSYYTFSDFFIQSMEEVPPDGIKIYYQFLHNNWAVRKAGLAWQLRYKKRGGKWNNYEKRIKRNVVFFGIQRIVPYNERSATRSYKYKFIPTEMSIERNKRICDIAGKILDKNYNSYELYQCSKYSLPHVRVNYSQKDFYYSGYNMGAGESSIFNILTALFDAGKGSMLVIDEIELALHEKAQKRLMEELKLLCKKFCCQIICSTHSPTVLNSVPPEGRFYIEAFPSNSIITPGISTLYAAGKLSGKNSGELDIFVEDEVSETIIKRILSKEARQRVNIKPIGSHEAVIRQLAARFKEDKQRECVAILDGDQRFSDQTHKNKFINYLESNYDKDEADKWINRRLTYLPGNQCPEKWLITLANELLQTEYLELTGRWQTKADDLYKSFNDGLRANNHSEFFVISQYLHLDEIQVRNDIAQFVYHYKSEEFEKIQSIIYNMIKTPEEGKLRDMPGNTTDEDNAINRLMDRISRKLCY